MDDVQDEEEFAEGDHLEDEGEPVDDVEDEEEDGEGDEEEFVNPEEKQLLSILALQTQKQLVVFNSLKFSQKAAVTFPSPPHSLFSKLHSKSTQSCQK